VTCERVLKASVNIKYDWNWRKEATYIYICDLYEPWKVKEMVLFKLKKMANELITTAEIEVPFS